MEYTLTSRKFNLTAETRKFIEQKLQKIEKFPFKISSVHVIINKESFVYLTEILVSGKLINIKGLGRANNLVASFELALDKTLVQVRKKKDKFKKHKSSRRPGRDKSGRYPVSDDQGNKPASSGEIDVYSLDDETDDLQEVIETKEFVIEKLDSRQALSRMKDLGLGFLVFIDRQTEMLSVIYRRPDGACGILKLKEKK